MVVPQTLVLLSGPVTDEGTTQYARAVLEALGYGPYLQLHILLPMTGELEQDVSADGTHLSELTREQYHAPPEEPSEEDDDEGEVDSFSSWETWDSIRALCDHSNRLSIGTQMQYLHPFTCVLPFSSLLGMIPCPFRCSVSALL